jgi:pilus assembly protein Flp/PilA
MEKEMNNVEIQREENEKGASMLEYCLLAALISVVAITAMTFLGTEVSQTFSQVGATINDAQLTQ